jgi:hypothetical protein
MPNKTLPTLKTGWDFFGGSGLGDGEIGEVDLGPIGPPPYLDFRNFLGFSKIF